MTNPPTSRKRIGLPLGVILVTSAAGQACEPPPIDEADPVETTAQTLLYVPNRQWHGDIPVCWEQDGYAQEKAWVQEALRDSWEAVSAVRFKGFQRCVNGSSPSPGIHVRMTNHDGSVGHNFGTDLDKVRDGLLLATWGTDAAPLTCAASLNRKGCVKATAVHEFGHALGFAHEQNRTDTPTWCTKGVLSQPGTFRIGDWDRESVMNYCNDSWAGEGLLSGGDIDGVGQLYGYGQSPLLFYNRNDGTGATALLDPNGAYTSGTNDITGFDRHWTHMVAGKNQTAILYNATSAMAAIVQLDSSGRYTWIGNQGIGFGWTHLTAVHNGYYLLFNRDDGEAQVIRVAADGGLTRFAVNREVGTNWTHVTGLNNGIVFFLDANAGNALIARISSSGAFTRLREMSGFQPWTHVTGVNSNGLFFYDSVSHTGATAMVDAILKWEGPTRSRTEMVALWKDGQSIEGFSDWTHVLGARNGTLFFFNNNTHTAATATVNAFGTFVNAATVSGFRDWSLVALD